MENILNKAFIAKVIATICMVTLTTFIGFSQINTYPIVGTGVTLSFNNTGVIANPVNPTDSFYGQNQGVLPAYHGNGDGTVTDLKTGLMWIQARNSKVTWDSAFILASQCTAGGYNDWRVPTIKELYSLINFNGRSAENSAQCHAYIDTNYFEWTTGDTTLGERVIDAQDWSANKYTGLTMVSDTTIFGVNFVDGRIKGYPYYVPGSGSTAKQKMYIRYVRGNTSYGVNNFVDNGDSTITDNSTGLVWAKNDNGSGVIWQDALAYAQIKSAADYCGYNDWRLPTAKELQSIVDYTRSKDFTNSAAINPIFNITSITDEGGNQNWPFFWTNTTHLEGGIPPGNHAVYICFGEALGWMELPPSSGNYVLLDVHGAGAQRSDFKTGDPSDYPHGFGPQGDVIRINNFVRLVRTDNSNTGGILDNSSKEPEKIILENYPNPFDSQTNLIITLPKPENIELSISDVTGRKIRVLANGVMNSGKNTVVWDGKDEFGQIVSGGLYFCILKTLKGTVVGRSLLLNK